MEEERVDRIVHPDQLELAAGERSLLDAGAVGERHQPAAAHDAGQPPPTQVVAESAEIDVDQLGRPQVERHREALASGAGCRGAAARSSR